MHSRDDLNCTRGYEFWLMKEAKQRNPDMITYGLPWGAPGWINNQTGYYGPDQITYQVNWLKCARDSHGIDVDYLGLWNERPWGTPDYVKLLRKTMDAEGLSKTKLVLGDGGMPAVMQYSNDSEFMNAFHAVGLHYPCNTGSLRGQGASLMAAGKKVWASEDWWSEAEYPGATCWAKLFNQNFIRMNLTSTISWSTCAHRHDCQLEMIVAHSIVHSVGGIFLT
jgi:galactosylceramidase